MRVLVAGAAGMLGQDVVDAARRSGHEVTALTRHELDITDPAAIDREIGAARPEAVIDCAAWSDVDGAEDDERGATTINATAAGLLAAAAARAGASILYPSTDYVFDGSKDGPYLEEDMPAPINAYGRSKLGGEVSVAAANPRHFIVRTSWLFGLGGGNFVETMLRIGAEQPEVLVVSDQVGCPTSTADLAEGMVELVATDAHGIHHMVGAGACSWFDFAVEIFDQARSETRVMSATTEMMARKATRPANSVLGHSREDAILLQPWQQALRRYLDDRELDR
ncbi:MAG TPA: dTDP-4-dehydrorhamnose reductase [Solirubrobacterales bacterium]|nr:dTDP-4-dehydrorhamnose reductase [Solirubrobacterales bacterium]